MPSARSSEEADPNPSQEKEQMNIAEIAPQTDPRWQALIDHSESSAFHSPGWMQVLVNTYGFEVRAYVVLDERGEPKAGLPFVRVRDMLGKRIVTLPFSDYCDPLVSHRQEWEYLTNRLLAEECPVIMRCLHNDLPLGDERFVLVKRAKWHGVNLQPELEALWRRLHESSRRAIHKAQRDGITVSIAQEKETLRAFFEMHLRVRKYKYRLLSQPYRFFENIWCHLLEEKKGFLMVASHQEAIIGGILFLEWQDKLYYKFNASVKNDLSHRPNDLLIWEGIKHGKARGCTQLDFGLSDWNQEGLVRYKRKFASEEKVISFLKYAPDTTTTEEEKQARGLLPQLTELFTDAAVSDEVTERAGDVLYGFFI
jgi:CelD/BcsL family acetyltransferase involved in cellulose biosynthesis